MGRERKREGEGEGKRLRCGNLVALCCLLRRRLPRAWADRGGRRDIGAGTEASLGCYRIDKGGYFRPRVLRASLLEHW